MWGGRREREGLFILENPVGIQADNTGVFAWVKRNVQSIIVKKIILLSDISSAQVASGIVSCGCVHKSPWYHCLSLFYREARRLMQLPRITSDEWLYSCTFHLHSLWGREAYREIIASTRPACLKCPMVTYFLCSKMFSRHFPFLPFSIALHYMQ